MQHHPEQKADEIYCGNISKERFAKMEWKSKRLGKCIYYSRVFKKDLLFPVFILVKEVEDAIQNLPDEDELIKLLWQNMVNNRKISGVK